MPTACTPDRSAKTSSAGESVATRSISIGKLGTSLSPQANDQRNTPDRALFERYVQHRLPMRRGLQFRQAGEHIVEVLHVAQGGRHRVRESARFAYRCGWQTPERSNAAAPRMDGAARNDWARMAS